MYAKMHFLSKFLVKFVVDAGACGVGCKALFSEYVVLNERACGMRVGCRVIRR
jgi:hypothetical protein